MRADVMTRETRSSVAVRWCGLAAMLGGLLWSLGFAHHATKPRGCIAEECLTRQMRASTALDGVLISSAMVLIVAGAVGLLLLIRRSGRVGALARAGLVLGGAGITTLAVAGLAQEKFFSGANEQTSRALLYLPFGVAWVAVGHALWSTQRVSPSPTTPS
jgi:hypothetical protein